MQLSGPALKSVTVVDVAEFVRVTSPVQFIFPRKILLTTSEICLGVENAVSAVNDAVAII